MGGGYVEVSDSLDVALGIMALWFMTIVLGSVITIRKLPCHEFMRRYRGMPVFTVVIMLGVSVGACIVLALYGGLTDLFLSSVFAVNVTYIGYAFYVRRVFNVCRSLINECGGECGEV